MGRRLLLLPLFLLAFGACRASEPEDGAADRVVIRYLIGPDIGGASAEIVERFEREHPHIKIEMVQGPGATDVRENMYSTSFMGGESTYDIVYMDVVWVPKFAAQGWLLPLDERFTPEMQKDFLPGDIEGSRYEGKIYRMPIQSDGGMLYYRKDLLAKAGLKPPRTWSELVAAARKLQSPPELWGFVFQGKQYEGLVCAFLELAWGNGGDVLGPDGSVVLDSPASIEALRWLVSAVHKDKIAPEGVLTFQEEEARHMFQEGKAVFMRNWPYAWNLAQQEGSPVRGKIGIVPMVHGEGLGHQSAATLGGWGFGISRFSKHPDEAWEFVRYAASAEAQKIGYLKGGVIPTRRSLFADPDVLATAPHFRDLLAVLEKAKPRPVHPAYARFSDAMQIHLSAALALEETPEEALAAAAGEIRAYLGRGRVEAGSTR